MRKLLWAGVCVCIWGAWNWWSKTPLIHESGVLAPEPPVQVELREPSVFKHGKYSISALAEFAIEARVLSREDYRFDAGAQLSPVDLALGWGRMSDQEILDQVEIRQSGRFYSWSVSEFPIPRREIETHSANMHLVPADGLVRDSIDRVRAGHLVALRGFLIRADRTDGWHWKSSLTRNDTGAGACELIWVEEFEIL